MLNLILLLGQATPPDRALAPGLPNSRPSSFGFQDLMLIAAILAALALLLFVVVYFSRRRPERHAPSGSRAIYKLEPKDAERAVRRRRLRRKRRRHPDNLPRNPTLQETGGLPPVRSGDPSPPAL